MALGSQWILWRLECHVIKVQCPGNNKTFYNSAGIKNAFLHTFNQSNYMLYKIQINSFINFFSEVEEYLSYNAIWTCFGQNVLKTNLYCKLLNIIYCSKPIPWKYCKVEYYREKVEINEHQQS